MKREPIPVWEKLTLTIDEAAEYSNIGTGKIRELLNEPDCDFVLRKGAYSLIKRVKFERYILEKEVI